MTSAHIFFIPGMILIGIFLGFIFGARAARNQIDLQQKRDEEREAARAARAARRAEAGKPDKPEAEKAAKAEKTEAPEVSDENADNPEKTGAGDAKDKPAVKKAKGKAK